MYTRGYQTLGLYDATPSSLPRSTSRLWGRKQTARADRPRPIARKSRRVAPRRSAPTGGHHRGGIKQGGVAGEVNGHYMGELGIVPVREIVVLFRVHHQDLNRELGFVQPRRRHGGHGKRPTDAFFPTPVEQLM